jgi:Flp pilus assembly protein TadG
MTTNQTSRRRSRRRSGQALVEFSLALIPFLLILMGIVDLGRGIYMSNGVTQAAREIARVTAVHLCNPSCCTLGYSAETLAVIATQKRLIPNLGSAAAVISISCTTVSDTAVTSTSTAPCSAGSNADSFVKVTVSVPYSTLTPILSMVAPSTLLSTAHIQVP